MSQDPYADVSEADFFAAPWMEIIGDCETKQCFAYTTRLGMKAREVGEGGSVRDHLVLALLRDVTSLHLRQDSVEEPYGPMAVFADGRTAALHDFTEAQVVLLTVTTEKISDPELRARMADVAWLRKRDFRLARLAVSSYIESAKVLEDPENWVASADRLERALHVAALLGRNGTPYGEVVAEVERLAADPSGDHSFLPARMMNLLLDKQAGDPAFYSERAGRLAVLAEGECEWDRAREYWRLKAKWHFAVGDQEEARNARLRGAETYVSQADAVENGERPSFLQASLFLQSAIEAFRQAGGASERVDALHHRLLRAQQRSASQFGSHRFGVDGTEMVRAAIDRVKGKTPHDALAHLALLCTSPNVEQLRRQAEELRSEFVFHALFPPVMVNALGRRISRQPADEEERVLTDMYVNASLGRTVAVQGAIEPARQQIALEHYLRPTDFLSYLYENPFVTPGREHIIARGLNDGLQGDFLAAVHLLIPQIEASLRYILYQAGVITSGLDDDGIQDEYNINKLLSAEEFRVPLSNILGADFVFDLKGLLVERFGANLRNDTAHGLIGLRSFYTDAARYLWWLSLRFFLWPKITPPRRNPEDVSSEGGEGGRPEVW